MRKLFFSLILLSNLMLGGCTYIMENLPGVYTLDIQQGNQISQDMINQLRPNMSKRQVLYIMGSPMLVDVFNKNRWDYLYSSQVEGDYREQIRVALYFDGETLTAIQGDFKPNANTDKLLKETTLNVPHRNLDNSLWGKTIRLFEADKKVILEQDDELDEDEELELDENGEEISLENEAENSADKIEKEKSEDLPPMKESDRDKSTDDYPEKESLIKDETENQPSEEKQEDAKTEPDYEGDRKK